MGVFKHKLDAARSAVNLLMSTDFIGLYDTYIPWRMVVLKL